jgi:hypothetical protein
MLPQKSFAEASPVTGVIVGVKAILPRANLDAWRIGFLLL